MLRSFDGLTPFEAHTGGNQVAVAWRPAAVTATGAALVWFGINVFHIDIEGMISEMHAYVDPAVFSAR